MRSVRRAIAASAVMMMMAVPVGTATATPAGAAANGKVTGTVIGSAPYTFGTHGCSFVEQNFGGSVTTRKDRNESINVDVCVEIGPVGLVATGTFAITTDRGQVSGTATGIISDPGVDLFLPLSFSFDLVVVDASHGLARRGSTLHFTGTYAPQGMGGPIIGTIVA